MAKSIQQSVRAMGALTDDIWQTWLAIRTLPPSAPLRRAFREDVDHLARQLRAIVAEMDKSNA